LLGFLSALTFLNSFRSTSFSVWEVLATEFRIEFIVVEFFGTTWFCANTSLTFTLLFIKLFDAALRRAKDQV
jgi:hypothetical protein